MKKLFGLLFVFGIFSLYFLGNVQPVVAQAQPAGSFDYFYAQGIDIFDKQIASLQQIKQAQAANPNEQARARITANLDKYIDLITQMKGAYIAKFNEKKANSTPSATQVAAIDAATQKQSEIFTTFTPSEKQEPTAQATMRVFIPNLNNLRTQAVQIGNGTITAGGNEAESLNNNGAVATAGGSVSEVVENSLDNDCFDFTGLDLGACISDFVQWIIKNTLLEFAGFFLWLASNMFSYAVQMGILEFKQWAPDTLYPLWLLVRQIISLGVVFIGLYLGFMYIIGKEETFARYLPWVVVFALFVNFSYPLVRFTTDVTNIISLNIYTATFSNEVLNGQSNASAGAIIMNKLGLPDLVMGATAVQGGQTANIVKKINSVPSALLVVAFVFYAAYVFFMATALLVMRTAVLVFLIVASPFLFIDSILPILGEKAKLLRKVFFEQLAVGPVFLLLLALTTNFITIFSNGPAKAALTQTSSPSVTVFFNILMMMIMLHLTIKITKSVSGTVGEMATNAMGKVGGFGLGVATAGTGLLARQTIGRAAMAARDSKWMTNNQNSVIGRRMYDMSNAFAKSSFDLRNSTVVAGGMQKAGMNMGKGRTVGYEEAMEARRKDILERGSRIKTRYERDVVDKNGNILHKQGEIDEEGEKARAAYYNSAGGTLFMPKEQKEKVQEEMRAKSKEQLAKDEAEVSRVSDDNLKRYNEIKKDIKGPDGRTVSVEVQKANELQNLIRELNTVKQRDPSASGIEAKALEKAIETIQKKNKEDEEAFEQKISSLFDRYQNVTGNDAQKEKARVSMLNNLDGKERAALQAKIQGRSVLPTERQRRLDLVATGRKEQLAATTEVAKISSDYHQEQEGAVDSLKKKHEAERSALLSAPGAKSSILDANGKPTLSQDTKNKLAELEKKHEQEMSVAINELELSKRVLEESMGNVSNAFLKQQASMDRASKAITPDINFDNLTPPVAETNWDAYNTPAYMRRGGVLPPDLQSPEDIGAKRQRDWQAGAERAQEEMERNARTAQSQPQPQAQVDIELPVTSSARAEADEAITRAQDSSRGDAATSTSSTPFTPRPLSGGALDSIRAKAAAARARRKAAEGETTA